MRIQFGVSGGLDAGQLEKIHRTALRILDEIGMEIRAGEVPTPTLLSLASSESGVRVVGDRLFFAPKLVEQYLDQFQSQLKAAPPSEHTPVLLYTGSHAFYGLPTLADAPVANTVDSLIESTRLIDSFHDEGVRGTCPGRPSDVPPFLQDLMQYKIACQFSRHPSPVSISAAKVAPWFHEMAAVMNPAKADDYLVGFHPISPLKLAGDEFEIALHFWKKFGDKLAVSVGPMPILGVSAPVFLPAALAQAVAEALGAFIFFKILTHGGKVDFFFNVYAFDMKQGSFAYGGPEDAIIGLMRNQMTQWYGLPNNAGNKALNTMGHLPDAQAASEKAMKTLMALMAGARSLAGAGGLSLDECFSPEQLVIDVEIAAWATHAVAGFEFNDQTLVLDAIRDVVSEKANFLEHESTLSHYRRTYWEPQLFEHLMLSQWKEKGQKTLRERAVERIRIKRSGPSYELARDKVRELDNIYRSARQNLG